jgi:hypothetical protein
MKTMKYSLMHAVIACLLVACTTDNPIVPQQDGPTAKEKAMVPTMMMWQLDSTLVINNPGTPIETYQMLYAGIDTYQWTFTFYPCTEKLPNDIIFYSDFEDYSVNVSEQYNKNYCKYLCTESGEVIAAGYLCYYRDMFTFDGLQQGCWVEFKLREASTDWNTDVWTNAYDSDVEQDGTVLERVIEYYSPVRDAVERGGSASVTVNGTTFSVDNARWDATVLNGNETFYTLQIYNCDVLGGADPMDIVSIVYKVPNGSQTALATGEFTDFEVSLTRTGSNEAQDRQYYTNFSDNAGAKLKVSKTGSGYLVQFGAMKYTVDGSAGATTYNGSVFSFAGAINKGLLLQ